MQYNPATEDGFLFAVRTDGCGHLYAVDEDGAVQATVVVEDTVDSRIDDELAHIRALARLATYMAYTTTPQNKPAPAPTPPLGVGTRVTDPDGTLAVVVRVYTEDDSGVWMARVRYADDDAPEWTNALPDEDGAHLDWDVRDLTPTDDRD